MKSMPSPTEIENLWKKTESRIIDSLFNLRASFVIFLFLFVSISYYIHYLWSHTSPPSWARFFISQDRYWATIVLISSAFLLLFINTVEKIRLSNITEQRTFKQFSSLLILSISWLFPIYQLSVLRTAIFIPLVYIILGHLFIEKLRINRWWQLAINLVLFLTMVIYLAFDVVENKDGRVFQYFSIIHTEFLLLYFIQRIFRSSASRDFDFSPIQLYTPFPIPLESKIVREIFSRKKQFLSGAFQILQAQLVFIFLTHFTSSDLIKSTSNRLIHYFTFLLFVAAAMKMVSGMLWLFGYQTPSASHFIFLAKSPLETWQRGSVFIAKFIFDNIYFPMWKIFRSVYLPALAVFIFIFIHIFIFNDFVLKNILAYLFPMITLKTSTLNYFLQQLTWMVLWSIWIFLFSKTIAKITFIRKTSWGNWLAIFLTHLGNVSIIPLTFYILEKFQ